ncbi:MAG TPA: response regulator [Minicystis sp.]|nr:response regulator [Minicystis sp.]
MSSSGPSVLVVDDDADLRQTLVATLDEAGYDVREAGAGRAAIDELRRAPPDLVLLDLMMPGGNGWDVLEAIRGDAKLRAVPVVVVSAYASSAPEGARALVRKPMGRMELLVAVASHVREPM